MVGSKVVLFSILLLLIPLGVHAYTGQFSRFLADDYCTASTLRNLGFFDSQIDWFSNWSGRFSFTFTINASQLLGTGVTPFITLIVLVLWLTLLTFTVNRIFRFIGLQIPSPWSLLIGALILLATLDSTPDIYQSLYWHTGAITYALPLVLFTLCIGLVSSGGFSKPDTGSSVLSLLGIWFLAFFSGGFSETFVTMQTAALAIFLLTLLLTPESDRKPSPAIVLAGLVGSILAMVTIVIAPGSAIRQSLMPASPNLLNSVLWSLRHGLAFTAKSALASPISIANSFIVPAILVNITPWVEPLMQRDIFFFRRRRTTLISLVVITYLLIVASIFPSLYATSAYPADRALVTAQYILTIGLVTIGCMVGLILRSRFNLSQRFLPLLRVLVVALLGVGFLISILRTTDLIPAARSFAEQWDQRDEELRLAFEDGQAEARVPSLPHMGNLAEIGEDPEEWINKCVAGSYGLERVVAEQ